MGEHGHVVTRAITDEVEGYQTSTAGIEIESVRAGRSIGPTSVLGAVGERFTFTHSRIGFPMLSRTTMADDIVVLGYVKSAPPGCRWCEIDLRPGAVLAWAPADVHTAHNRPGLEFMFAVADGRRVLETADQHGIRIEPPGRGEVHLLAPTAERTQPC